MIKAKEETEPEKKLEKMEMSKKIKILHLKNNLSRIGKEMNKKKDDFDKVLDEILRLSVN